MELDYFSKKEKRSSQLKKKKKKKKWIKTAWAMHAVIPCRHEVCIFGIQCNSVKQKTKMHLKMVRFFLIVSKVRHFSSVDDIRFSL